MSDFYTTIESEVLALLQANAGLAEKVKTFEATVRECLYSGDKMAQGFRPDELPAINLTAQQKPVKSAPYTIGQTAYTIPLTVLVVTKAQDSKEARRKVRELQNDVEMVLHQARGSAVLGFNEFVQGDVTSDFAVVQDQPFRFGIGKTDAEILKIVDQP